MESDPSATDIEALWRTALSDYHKKTGVDLVDAANASGSRKGEAVEANILFLLQDHQRAFEAFRKGDPKEEMLMNVLRPVAKAVSVLSSLIGESLSVVRVRFVGK